jgi:hypothetical protein
MALDSLNILGIHPLYFTECGQLFQSFKDTLSGVADIHLADDCFNSVLSGVADTHLTDDGLIECGGEASVFWDEQSL